MAHTSTIGALLCASSLLCTPPEHSRSCLHVSTRQLICSSGLATITLASTDCIISGNRTSLITVTTYFENSTDCWTNDGSTCLNVGVTSTGTLPSELAIVDGVTTEGADNGWFLYIQDQSYMQFEFTTDVIITTVKFYMQHDAYPCYFKMIGVDSSGTATELSDFLWPDSSDEPETSELQFTNTASYPTYRLKKYTNDGTTCRSPRFYEIEFPNAECFTSVPTRAPTTTPVSAAPTRIPTPSPTQIPSPAPSYTPCSLTFGAGYQAAESEGCVSLFLDSETECKVICSNGYTSDGGTQTFQCTQGAITRSPSLVCTPDPCRINTFAEGVTNATTTM